MRILFLLSFTLASCTYSPMVSQKVVLDVNGTKMHAGEFAKELAYRLKDQDALSAKDPKFVAQVKSRIEQDFIIQSLSDQWAKEKGLIVKAEDFEAQVQKIKASYPDDLAFQQILAQEGISFKEWRDKMMATMVQKLVVEKLSDKSLEPSEAEIKKYYDDNRPAFMVRAAAKVRQIMLGSEGDAQTIEAELKKGKNFGDLAKKYSISPEGPMGGDVGWMEKGQSEVFEPAIKMRNGERSGIVKSPYGYHIYEKTAHREQRPKTLSEAKDEIRTILVEKKQRDLYFAWLDEQTRKAHIFKDSDLIAALKVETKLK
jgi:parvulin-like peptidyl-prolyl isomerase